MESTCACECGEPAARGSKYAVGHFKYWTVIRRRFRALRRYAWSRGIHFTINEHDLADVIGDRWANLVGVAIRRVDPDRGLVPGNLRLASARRARPESEISVRRRLAKCLRRREIAKDLTLDELHQVFKAQRGRCWSTGRRLRLKLGTRHPAALAIVKIDPIHGYEPHNIRLVVRAVAIASLWGEEYLIALARDIVRFTDERRVKLEAREERVKTDAV